MSVTLRREERYDCAFEECNETRTSSTSVAGSYCSRDCADRAAGRALLRTIRQDHRFCWSCWRRRKEIERPTDPARRGLGPVVDSALVGYEYTTGAVERGPYGIECKCGALDHDDPAYDRRDEGPYQWFLYVAVERLVAEGQRDSRLEIGRLADELWADDDEVPLELAVGRALEA